MHFIGTIIAFIILWYIIGVICTLVCEKYDAGVVYYSDLAASFIIGILGPLVILLYLGSKLCDYFDANSSEKFW